jgi:integrase/recombinase XerD
MTDQAISPLRRRMIGDMAIGKLAPKTQHDYVQRAKDFVTFLGLSPDTAKSEEVRGFRLYLASSGAGTPKINAMVSALRFFFNVTLDRPDLAKHLSFMHEPRKVPIVLSPEEVARFLEAAPSIKYKASLSVAYGAGLRVSEVVSLKVSDIDSERMMLRVERGKGRKDRHAMRFPVLLALLRDWYRIARPQGWLFPGQNPANPMTTRQLSRACHAVVVNAAIILLISVKRMSLLFSRISVNGTSRNRPDAYPRKVILLIMPACCSVMPSDEPIGPTRIWEAKRLLATTPIIAAASNTNVRSEGVLSRPESDVSHVAIAPNTLSIAHLSLPSVGRKTYSGAGRLRDVEAILQHLVARYDIAGDRQDDGKLRRNHLAGRLDTGLERSDDCGAVVAGEDVLDFEADGFGQRADIADEIGDCLATGLAADPGKHAVIALDLEYEIGVEQGCDLGRIPSTADSFQKLLRNSDILLMAHFLSP